MDVGQLRFLDSYQYMGMGLDKLVDSFGGKLALTVKHFTERGYALDKLSFYSVKTLFSVLLDRFERIKCVYIMTYYLRGGLIPSVEQSHLLYSSRLQSFHQPCVYLYGTLVI